MFRGKDVHEVEELKMQGFSLRAISDLTGYDRKTIRKYLISPEAVPVYGPRPKPESKLDPFKEQIHKWINEDHCSNCEAMLPRLLDMGYTGSLSVLKAFVHPLRPPQAGHAPVQRFETEPGEQVADITFHDLRHDFGHRLRAAGFSLEEVAVSLGHVTKKGTPAVATTARYTQPSRAQMKHKLKDVTL